MDEEEGLSSLTMPEIKAIKKEYEEILQKFSDPRLISDWNKVDEPRSSSPTSSLERVRKSGSSFDFANARVFKELLKRKNFLEKIITKQEELRETKSKIEENKAILSTKEDPELVSLAQEELPSLLKQQKVLEKELKSLLNDGKSEEKGSVIVEIRAGAGGDESCLFVGDIFRMYSKYAQLQNWQQKILNSHPAEIGGFKEIIFELKNGNVFSEMKYEGGVHRVQRIPQTEKSGRIHTSTVSVAVLLKPKSAQIKIGPDDLKIDFYRSSGPGGQYVNKRETAVRITHLPTGLVVTSQTERNQLRNKEDALAILEARLLEKTQREEEEKVKGKRKDQVGWAKRAEKIRTYNFPHDRVTDHRIKKSWHNIEGILNGKLELIIKALKRAELS